MRWTLLDQIGNLGRRGRIILRLRFWIFVIINGFPRSKVRRLGNGLTWWSIIQRMRHRRINHIRRGAVNGERRFKEVRVVQELRRLLQRGRRGMRFAHQHRRIDGVAERNVIRSQLSDLVQGELGKNGGSYDRCGGDRFSTVDVDVVALEGGLHVLELLQDLRIVLGNLEQLHSIGVVQTRDAYQMRRG